MSTRAGYVFNDAEGARELSRLRAIEAIFDPDTRRCLSQTGEWAGRSCLEVGAGAGSIAAWLAQKVGENGRVLAVDTNTRFLERLEEEREGVGLEVVKGDIRGLGIRADEFDLVHARYVLIHNAEASEVLEAMLRCLKAGAWLLLEEPDFSTARAVSGPAPLKSAFENVNRAIASMFTERGMDHAFGRRLPTVCDERGVETVSVECHAHVERGGSPLARMMRLSTEQLEQKYIATGQATASDIAGYAKFASDTACWGLYYSTVRVLGRKVG